MTRMNINAGNTLYIPPAAQANICIIMASATFKSSNGNATKRFKLPQIRKKSK